MTDKVARSLRKRAKTKAEVLGFKEEAEDLAQEVMLSYASGSGKHQRIDYAVIDAIRKTIGRPDREKNPTKQEINRNYVDLHSLASALTYETRHDDFGNYLKVLQPVEKAIVCLRFKWGLEFGEIGECFGLSEGRICQIMKTILDSIREAKATGKKQKKSKYKIRRRRK